MNLNRSSFYCQPKGESDRNPRMMRIIDEYYTEHPTLGVVHMRDMLRGYLVDEKRVRRLMCKMDILMIYPQGGLSKGTVASCVHPYLLRALKVGRPSQVWSKDISYIPMEKGFMCLYPADTVEELREGIGKWIRSYNFEHPHQSISNLLPAMDYEIVVAA